MSTQNIDAKGILETEIQTVLTEITKGRVDGVSYDTAWVARLSPRYPTYGFDQSLDWIRQNQYEDGTWGASLVHYHDRFISTLAAVVALKDVGDQVQDTHRIKLGEDALWKLIGHLGKDNSDTIGFPILSAALAEEAVALGLDVPRPPMRYAAGYKKKIAALFSQPKRDWRTNSVSFSLEALRFAMHDDDEVLEENYAVSMSPSATASYLFTHQNEGTLSYLQHALQQEGTGAIPAVHPIDIFETTWSLNHLRLAGAIESHDPNVRSSLDYLWKAWSPVSGVSCSTYFTLPNLDDVASGYSALHWGGYAVETDVFAQYEYEDHFYCFPNETDPSLGAHVRLLAALKQSNEPERHRLWINKIVGVLERFDQNGTFWWDKWHVSPYYLSSSAVIGLQGIADTLALSRVRWMLRTQNKDGGWGYLGTSTPEETAYCLEALLYWERTVESVDPDAIDAGARYLESHINDTTFTPMWIGKSLYTPFYPVKAAVLGAMFTYINQRD